MPASRICPRVSSPSQGGQHFPWLTVYSRHAPFIYNAWKDPETLRIISNLASIDVVPVMDYDIAHINVSGPSIPHLSPLEQDRNRERVREKEIEKPKVEDKNDAIVSWHNDSYAFVCVTMLSDCTGMTGGETALKTADGSVIKVRGPQRVSPSDKDTIDTRSHLCRATP
jgi:hypothetical protein